MFLVVVDGVAVLVVFVVMGLPSVGESVVIVVAAAFFDVTEVVTAAVEFSESADVSENEAELDNEITIKE